MMKKRCAEGAGNAEKGEFPQAPVVGSRRVGHDFAGEKAVVYFSARSTPSISRSSIRS